MIFYSRLFFTLFFATALCNCALFQRAGNTEAQFDVVYKTQDDGPLVGDLYLPQSEGLRPAVIVVHGGGWDAKSGNMANICLALARAGFVAFDVNYRLAPQHLYPSAVEDVKDSIRWLKAQASRYRIDPEKMGIWGYSAGAHLALLASLDTDLGIRAAVTGGTPADLTQWPDSPLVNRFLGHSLKERPDLWREASPISHVTEKSPPVFMYHGEWDHLVEPEQVQILAKALAAKKRPYEIHMVPVMGHIAVFLLSQESVDQGIEFLKRNLETGVANSQ